jgi:NAD(P)-dependent dehydrogenase (short-subunit alcohol dehydrogenase family)
VKEFPDRVTVVQLEASDERSVKHAAKFVEEELQGHGLDVLINNAGIAQYAPAGTKSM